MNRKLPREIYAIQFIALMCFSSLSVFNLLPLYFKHLGGSPGKIGFLMGIFSFAAFAARPFGGWLLGKVDPKKVLVVSLFLQFVTTGFYMIIGQLDWFLILVRVIHGFTFSTFILAALLIAVTVTTREQRAYALGVVSSGFVIPLIIWPFLGEGVIVRFGYPAFFLLAVVLAFIPFLYSLFAGLPSLPPIEEKSRKAPNMIKLLMRRKILVFVFLTLLFEIAFGSILSFVPLLAHNGSFMRAGYFYSFLGMTAVFLRLFAGKRLRFWGRPELLLPAFVFLSSGIVSLYFSHAGWHLALSGLICGLGIGILFPHLSSLIIDNVKDRDRSRVLGLFAAFSDLGFAVGPVMFGFMSQIFGIRQFFPIFGGAMLFLILIIMGVGKKEIYQRNEWS